jgi:hypothetical protein
MDDPRRPERLVALFLLAALLFSPALLAIFARPATLLGVPALFVYVFASWAAVIALLALASRGARREPPER